MVKIRDINTKDVEQFISELADKPYGTDERQERITISLEGDLYDKIDDIVRSRKRQKMDNRSISAYIREAVLYYMSCKK